MPATTWKTLLGGAIHSFQQADRLPRVALVGLGRELCGDDSAGLLVARGLLTHLPEDYETIAASLRPALLVIEAEGDPEAFTGRLRDFHPDLVLLVAAAELRAHPGTVRWLDWRDIETVRTFTYGPALPAVSQHLAAALNCRVAWLGIQPASHAVGHDPTLLAQLAIDSLVIDLISMLWLKAMPA